MSTERNQTEHPSDPDLTTRSSLAELAEKARISVRQSFEDIGRPAMERFEGQHELRDVRVNHLRSAA